MHRLIRPAAISTLAAAIGVSTLAVASFAGPGVAAGANPGKPSSAPQLLQTAAEDAGDYWTEQRMSSAKPMTNVREQRNKPKVRKNRAVQRRAHSFASIDNATGGGGDFVEAAQNQPSANYPYPFGRRGLEKQIRKVAPYKTVGRIFFRQGGVRYSCSGASVVGGPRHVVFTAGHCLNDGNGTSAIHWSTDVVFIPGRTSGKKKNPYGKFAARQLWTPLGWSQDGLDSYDLGAFSVGKSTKHKKGRQGKTLRKSVGALGFAYNEGRIQHWDIFGYPAQTPWRGNKVVTCATQHAIDDDMGANPNTLGVGCDMNGGSSGGPWVMKLRRNNLLNGITTYGYQNQPAALYGPWFDQTANNLRCAAAKNNANATNC
jgi:hypothetical protein